MGTYTIQQCQTAIEAVAATKNNIKSAILEKGGTVASDAPLSDYPTAIRSIPSGGGDEKITQLKELIVEYNGDYSNIRGKFGDISIDDIYTDYARPEMYYDRNNYSWHQLEDNNGSTLYSSILPEDFWDFQTYKHSDYSKQYVIDALLGKLSSQGIYPEEEQPYLYHNFVSRYDDSYNETSYPSIRTRVIANNDTTYKRVYANNLYQLDNYYGPDNQYSIGSSGNNNYFYGKPVYSDTLAYWTDFAKQSGDNSADYAYMQCQNTYNKATNTFTWESYLWDPTSVSDSNITEAKKGIVFYEYPNTILNVSNPIINLSRGNNYREIYLPSMPGLNATVNVDCSSYGQWDQPQIVAKYGIGKGVKYLNINLNGYAPYALIPSGYYGGVFYRASDLDTITFTGSWPNTALSSYSFLGSSTSNEPNPVKHYVFNTSNNLKVLNAYYLFANNKNMIDCPFIDTSSATRLDNMFSGCHSLTSIPQLNTSSATNMNSMFYGCRSLTSIPNIDVSRNTDWSNICNGCSSITETPAWNISNYGSSTSIYWMFGGCSNLETINLTALPECSMPYAFYGCNKLSATELNKLIALLPSTSKSNMQFGIGNTNLAKLTPAEIAVATGKGWTLN